MNNGTVTLLLLLGHMTSDAAVLFFSIAKEQYHFVEQTCSEVKVLSLSGIGWKNDCFAFHFDAFCH